MNHESGNISFPFRYHGRCPGVAVEQIALGDGDPEIEIVNHGGIDFPLFKPPVSRRSCKYDGVFIGKTTLPAAKRRREIALVRNIGLAQSAHNISSLSC